MYSFNHPVRYCSILNLHILITQMVLPNQSKHMDALLRELHGYYAAHAHAHPRRKLTTQHRHFPKVKQMPNTIFYCKGESVARGEERDVPPSSRPPPINAVVAGSSTRTASPHTHLFTHTHLSVRQWRCQQCHVRARGSSRLCQDCVL